MHDGLIPDDPQIDPDRAVWLGRLVTATGEAIDRVRKYEDPAHAQLVEDLQSFRARLVAELAE